MDGCLTRLGFAAFWFLFFSANSFADKVNNEWLSTTRSLSMGNVGISSAEDPTTAMFYNPAALARKKKTTIEFFNPQVEFSTGIFKTTSNQQDYSKNLSLGQVAPNLRADTSRVTYLGSSLYPNIHAENFNFGILVRGEGGAFASNDGTLTYRSRYILMPTMGISMSALGGRFKIGTAVRMLQLTENDKTVTNITNIGYRTNPQEGFGIGLDAGALLSLPWSALPTLGFVARNVGDTAFPSGAAYKIGQGVVTRHEKIKGTFDASAALFPKMGSKSVLTLAADYRDIQDKYKVSKKRKINLGMEFDINHIFYLRAGFGRGYWTAGIGLASKHGSLDIGTYAEELNATEFLSREDRRISMRYGARF